MPHAPSSECTMPSHFGTGMVKARKDFLDLSASLHLSVPSSDNSIMFELPGISNTASGEKSSGSLTFFIMRGLTSASFPLQVKRANGGLIFDSLALPYGPATMT